MRSAINAPTGKCHAGVLVTGPVYSVSVYLTTRYLKRKRRTVQCFIIPGTTHRLTSILFGRPTSDCNTQQPKVTSAAAPLKNKNIPLCPRNLNSSLVCHPVISKVLMGEPPATGDKQYQSCKNFFYLFIF